MSSTQLRQGQPSRCPSCTCPLEPQGRRPDRHEGGRPKVSFPPAPWLMPPDTPPPHPPGAGLCSGPEVPHQPPLLPPTPPAPPPGPRGWAARVNWCLLQLCPPPVSLSQSWHGNHVLTASAAATGRSRVLWVSATPSLATCPLRAHPVTWLVMLFSLVAVSEAPRS